MLILNDDKQVQASRYKTQRNVKRKVPI